MPNFADAPGDLSRDGRSWTTVKDYAQWHEVARTIAGHIIDRYGEDALSFTWSVFNEPDLGRPLLARGWDELQTFYDYTTDAILRAFEDRGYDSDKVFIGGLELGGIFGTNLRLREFLAHCSPTPQAQGALAAERRVRRPSARRQAVAAGRGTLPRARRARGARATSSRSTPTTARRLMAAKLTRAKEMALEIDPDYYRALWVNSHESCPDWMPPPDEAAADTLPGQRLFPELVRRRGPSPAPPGRCRSALRLWRDDPDRLAAARQFRGAQRRDADRPLPRRRDGQADRTATVPMPIFHVLGLLSDMESGYWVLPEKTSGAIRSAASSPATTRALCRSCSTPTTRRTRSRDPMPASTLHWT